MDKKYWEDIHSQVDALTRLDTTYTNSSVNALADYAETAQAMASIMQRTSMNLLGKRKRPLDDNVQDDAKANGNGKDNTVVEEQVSDMDGDTVDDHDADIEDSNSIPLRHDDEQLNGFKTAIFNLGCKKLLGKPWTDDERRLLDQITNNPFVDIHPPLAQHITHILKSELCHDDVYLLKLSLSGIVNTIRSSDFDHVRSFLPAHHLEERLDSIAAEFRRNATTNEVKSLLRKVTNTFVQGSSTEDTILLVHELQRPLLLSKQRTSQAYRALDAVAAFLTFMGSYNNNDTEATVLRRFMTILSIVFSNNTSIKLIEGETTSACTKSVQRVNVALYKAGHGQSFGRKIDILVKHDQGSGKYIELSSLEVKPGNAGPALIRNQQNKNLRTNGAILAYLSSLDRNCSALQTTAAIDFVGSAGYVYVLTNIEGIFYARQVGLITLPKSRSNFIQLTETLDLLFAFETFIVNLGQEAQAAMEYRESLDNICEVANVRQECIPSPHHDIFITPTHRK
ncbi:hypothetical protein DFQ29_000934 [Apophysomyces sp. BC1021]|nr:hypothetical protein DFQ29_000934 [Apophysomyces sp. BC1021]